MDAQEARRESRPQPGQQWLVVLAGVVGSGKSTLSSAWSRALPDWVRVNQDDLGDRRTCEQVVRSHLGQGRNVVLDRQNFDRGQRRTWLEIANEFPNVKVGGMVMGTTLDDCRSRLVVRENHPTIDNPQLALSLLDKFASLWEEPRLDEGFDHLVTLPSLPPSPEIDATLILSLLSLLYASILNPLASQQRQRRPPPPRAQPGFVAGWSSGPVYRRPDGFVDDGTWRPPVPSSRPPSARPGQGWPVSHNHGATRRPENRSNPSFDSQAVHPRASGPAPSYVAGGHGGSQRSAQQNRWAQGPPHRWGPGRTLGGTPRDLAPDPARPPPPPPPPPPHPSQAP
ncbi:hypothetical protein JCM10212_001316 [Sporobolomyces blumeae]